MKFGDDERKPLIEAMKESYSKNRNPYEAMVDGFYFLAQTYRLSMGIEDAYIAVANALAKMMEDKND